MVPEVEETFLYTIYPNHQSVDLFMIQTHTESAPTESSVDFLKIKGVIWCFFKDPYFVYLV